MLLLVRALVTRKRTATPEKESKLPRARERNLERCFARSNKKSEWPLKD